MRFTIRAKLILGFTLILLLMGAMGWESVTRLGNTRRGAEDLEEDLALSQRIARLVSSAEALNREALEIVFARTAERNATGADREALERAANAALAELNEQRDGFLETLAALETENADELALFGTLAQDLPAASERLLTQIDRQIDLASDPETSGATFIGGEGFVGGDAEVALEAWLAIPTALAHAIRADADADLTDIQNAVSTTRKLVLILVILGIAVATVVALWASRTLVGGVTKLVAASERVSAGEVDVTLEIDSNDEIGDLAAAFRETVAYHREHSAVAAAIANGDLDVHVQPRSERDVLGNALARMADNLRDFIGGLEAANVKLETEVGERTRAEKSARASADERQRALVEVETARKRAERAARNDQLTGLGNRAYFHEQLTAAIARAAPRGGSLAVMFIDLDRFKLVNDSLSHSVGDDLLRAVAERIGAALRAEDTVARLGGDEFAVLMTGPIKERDAAVAAARIIEAVRPPFAAGGHRINITASAGVSLFPTNGASADDLLKSADIAMYRAKERGRGRVEFASAELSAAVSARQLLEQRLWSAMENESFELHFQPIVSLRSDRVVSGEALLRWRDGSKVVSAGSFIPVAEDTGLIVELGGWIIKDALTHLSEWSASGLSDMRVAVNVSPNQLFYGDVVAEFLQAIELTGVSPKQVVVELTESAVAGDIESIADTLGRLKEIGFSVALDDFGTGHSSLSHLATLPIDVVKIDQSFVRGLPHQRGSVAIVEAIIELARRLGISVVAEGVETDEQLKFLKRAGCDAAQGFLLSHALPAAEFAAFVRAPHSPYLAA